MCEKDGKKCECSCEQTGLARLGNINPATWINRDTPSKTEEKETNDIWYDPRVSYPFVNVGFSDKPKNLGVDFAMERVDVITEHGIRLIRDEMAAITQRKNNNLSSRMSMMNPSTIAGININHLFADIYSYAKIIRIATDAIKVLENVAACVRAPGHTTGKNTEFEAYQQMNCKVSASQQLLLHYISAVTKDTDKAAVHAIARL